MTPITHARSLLFVPGDRPDRFDKAWAAGADAVIVDLEDAVAPAGKSQARSALADWLNADRAVVVRINAADTDWFEDDVALCDRAGVAGIMLPKAVAGPDLARVAGIRPVIALVETARGVTGVAAIARTPGVRRLALGTIDLALELGMDAPDVAFDPVRLQMTIAARVSGIGAPIDGVTRDVRDPGVAEADARRARSLGMTGKLCIHPNQIAAVHRAFRPGDADISKARRIVATHEAAAGRATMADGQMIDRPVVDRALALLRRAADHGHDEGAA